MTTHHRIKSLAVATALALGVGAAPASAFPTDLTANGSEVPAGSPTVTSQATIPATPPTIVRVSAPGSGFDWGDAGIGAAGGFALSMIGIGGALVVAQRRTTRRETALTS
jgi:hypothetical protein